jgi:hypothetical protein
MNKRQIKKMYDKFARFERVNTRWVNNLATERYLHRIEKIRGLPPSLRTLNAPKGLGKYATLRGRVFQVDLYTMARWFEGEGRQIAYSSFAHKTVEVSTVFLSIDHSFHGGKPVLWETMVFGGKHDGYQLRATSEEEAHEQHDLACKMVTGEAVL